MSDPDDTLPPRPSEPPRPVRPIPPDDLGPWLVDGDSITLASWCAAWAQRGYALEELVGVVHDCTCRTKVFPRAQLGSRYEAGDVVRQSLERAPAQSRRLTVAALMAHACTIYHVNVPLAVAKPDPQGLLVPLTPERRRIFDRFIVENARWIRRTLMKKVLSSGQGLEDVMVVVHRASSLGGFYCNDSCSPGQLERRHFLEAARYHVQPYKVLFLLEPEQEGEGHAIAWVDPERLGFFGEEKAALTCHGQLGYPVLPLDGPRVGHAPVRLRGSLEWIRRAESEDEEDRRASMIQTASA